MTAVVFVTHPPLNRCPGKVSPSSCFLPPLVNRTLHAHDESGMEIKGLLDFAFSPSFTNTGLFYVSYTIPGEIVSRRCCLVPVVVPCAVAFAFDAADAGADGQRCRALPN